MLPVTDQQVQQRFWSAALDYEAVRTSAEGDDVVLSPRESSGPREGSGPWEGFGPCEGSGPSLCLQAAPCEQVLPARIHLALDAADQTAEVVRLEGLGARQVHCSGRPADADCIVMEDPEGNRFCVTGAG